MINWIAPTLCPPNKVVYVTFYDGELNVQTMEKGSIETWITSSLIEDLDSINKSDHVFIGYGCKELGLGYDVDEGNTKITKEDIYKFAALLRQGWEKPFTFDFSYAIRGDYVDGKVVRFG
tara:strand:+ start:1421 stop:1780 length:360 start_codon:yes stop_codon:yes gene_type:complete